MGHSLPLSELAVVGASRLRFLVARVPRFNLRYLGQLPIAQNPRLLVAGVTLERRTRRGEIDPADSEFQGLVYRNGQNRDFGGPAECA